MIDPRGSNLVLPPCRVMPRRFGRALGSVAKVACLAAMVLAPMVLTSGQAVAQQSVPAQAAPARDQTLALTAATAPAIDGWQWLEKMPEPAASAPERGTGLVVPDRFRAIRVDLDRVRELLALAPMERSGGAPVELRLPMPDGTSVRVAIFESPVMAPGLAARFPQIKTYIGRGIDDPTINLRLDVTPAGLGAIMRTREGTVRIDSYSREDATVATVSWWRDMARAPWSCEVVEGHRPGGGPGRYGARSDLSLRVFRIAVSTTGEYTQYHGGNVASGLAAIVTTINRVNGIFESDHALRFVVTEGNDQVVFVDPETDPFSNQSPVMDMVVNQGLLDAVLGSQGYDIGHVFGTGGAGSAGGVGTACVDGVKAKGFSGITPPAGDAFAVDYVAHELGHQMGARHTFNNCRGSAGDDPSICHEPGSGSTVMGYAGICGATNVQFMSDPYFHATNIDQVREFIESGDGAWCAAIVPLTNQSPDVDAGPEWIVPHGTLFTLTASGSDPDGDGLFFAWEQRDGGPPASFPLLDLGSGPLFRSFAPVSSPSRTFPRLEEVLEGTLAIGESYPMTDRVMNFRVTARDNRAGGGGTDSDDTTVTVTTQAGPFRVLTPLPQAHWSGTRVVTWDVAGTDQSPLFTQTVTIDLSLDGGVTFPIALATATPNDGAEVVTMPLGVLTSQARVRVHADNSIYFDVSDGDFTVSPSSGTAVLVGTGVVQVDDTRANGNANGRTDPGEAAVLVSVQIANDGGSSTDDIVGTLQSLTPTARVIQDFGAYPELDPSQVAFASAPFVIAVAPDHPCGDPIQLRLLLSSEAGGGLVEFALPTGSPGIAGQPQPFGLAGVSIAIPDNNATGVTVQVPVFGMGGPGVLIGDVDFKFEGDVCSNAVGATGVGLSHTWVGDLVVTLTSPNGTRVRVINRPGGTEPGSSGNNFCQTRLDDDGPWASIQNIPSSGMGAPYQGSWLPAEPLAAFDGGIAEGTWSLTVQDLAQFDSGRLRSFSIIISPLSASICEPPTAVSCYGDFNQDENEDLTDAQMLAQSVVGLIVPEPGWLDGDFNGDENVDLLDAQQLALFVVTGACP